MPQLEIAQAPASSAQFRVREYHLAATLDCGQAFRWRESEGAWEGVIGLNWVRLAQHGEQITAETATPVSDWSWLIRYLQLDVDIASVLAEFPDDPPMQAAVAACRGLRLLRQDPWECAASFILSSTKQIVQIQQIIGLLCARFGEPLEVPPGHAPVCSFPTPNAIAAASEADLRACKMGFRAPYLKAAAQQIASGEVDLEALQHCGLDQARAALLSLPGVGRKIADCILLFGYGYPTAFPVDVWVMRGLRELYFRNRAVKMKRLLNFSATHFGPFSGYAQQYLFHYIRTCRRAGPIP